MIELLLIAGGAAAVVSGLILVKRARGKAADAAKPEPARDRTPTTIRAGDIVSHLGSDYLVTSRWIFNEEGFRWFEHDLEDGPTHKKLVVSLDDRLRVYLLTPDEELARDIGDAPAGDRLEVRDTAYRLAERGAATRFDESAPDDQPQDVRYWDYEGPGGRVLWLVKVADRMTAAVGEEVQDSMLDLYPGSS